MSWNKSEMCFYSSQYEFMMQNLFQQVTVIPVLRNVKVKFRRHRPLSWGS
jgi:hypothetical protein